MLGRLNSITLVLGPLFLFGGCSAGDVSGSNAPDERSDEQIIAAYIGDGIEKQRSVIKENTGKRFFGKEMWGGHLVVDRVDLGESISETIEVGDANKRAVQVVGRPFQAVIRAKIRSFCVI